MMTEKGNMSKSNVRCDTVYYFTKPDPNFKIQASFFIGKVVKKKISQRLLYDFLFMFDKYLSFYKKHEKRIDEDDFTRYVHVMIWEDKIKFFWDNYEMPRLFLHEDKAVLLIRKPKQDFYTYTREYHADETRESILNEVFERFEKETWKERSEDS